MIQLPKLSDRAIGISAAAFTGLCWATLAVMLKVMLDFSDTFTIAWFRLSFAFLILLFWMAWKTPAQLRILTSPPILGLVCGLGLAGNYIGYMIGLSLTGASNAQIMIQVAPISLILIGVFYFKEYPTRTQLAGFIIAAAGFALFYKDQLNSATRGAENYNVGNMWILFAAISWTLFAAVQKVLLKKFPANQLNLLNYALGTLLLFPFCNTAIFANLDFWQWSMMCIAGLNTVLAYGSLAIAFKKIPASEVSIIVTMNPLVTLLFMFILDQMAVTWVENEPLHLLGAAAAIVVVIGVILAVRKPKLS
jgi:drug/metabolite transporter (DMT)-like permease